MQLELLLLTVPCEEEPSSNTALRRITRNTRRKKGSYCFCRNSHCIGLATITKRVEKYHLLPQPNVTWNEICYLFLDTPGGSGRDDFERTMDLSLQVTSSPPVMLCAPSRAVILPSPPVRCYASPRAAAAYHAVTPSIARG